MLATTSINPMIVKLQFRLVTRMINDNLGVADANLSRESWTTASRQTTTGTAVTGRDKITSTLNYQTW
jgi:hypothetical protein